MPSSAPPRHVDMPRIVLLVMVTFTHLATVVETGALSGSSDTFLWIVQWSLAVSLVVGNTLAAVVLLTGRLDRSRIPALAALSGPMLVFLGASHVAGGLGLVLPQLTGVLPWLTPTAALALAVQAFMAAGFHLRAREEALEPALWGALFAVIAVGRIDLADFASPISGTAIVVATVVVLIAATINMVILLRGPRNPFRATATLEV